MPFIHPTLNAQWSQTGGPNGGIVSSVENINGVIWAGTPSGLYKSYDDGLSWNRTNIVSTSQKVSDIAHQGNKIALVVSGFIGGQSHLLFSDNNGQTWTDNDINGMGVDKIFFADGSLFSHSPLNILRSNDNGATWTIQNKPMDIEGFGHDDQNFISGGQDIYLSTDFGNIWNKIFTLKYHLTGTIFIEDSLIIIPALDSIYVSHDLGNTFSGQFSLTPGTTEAPFITRAPNGCLDFTGAGGLTYESCDNGDTWINLNGFFTANDATAAGNTLVFGGNTGFSKLEMATAVEINNGYQGASTGLIWVSPNGVIYTSLNYTGTTIYTTNEGLSWQTFKYSNDELVDLDDMYFIGDTIVAQSFGEIFTIINGQKNVIFNSLNLYKLDVFGSNIIIWENNADHISISGNLGQSWSDVSLPTNTTEFHIVGSDWIAVSTTSSETKIFVSQDNGASWTEKYSTNYMGSLTVVDDWLISKDWQISKDHGQTWTQLAPTGMPTFLGQQVLVLESLTKIGNTLYTIFWSFGVYASTDGGLHWAPFNDGLGSLMGNRLAKWNNKLFYTSKNMGTWVFGQGDLSLKTGMVYIDQNNNGILDVGEKPVGDILLKTNQVYTNSNTIGNFNFYSNSSTDSITVVSPSPFTTVSPVGYPVTSAQDGYDFGIYWEPNHPDLQLTLTNLSVFRPGFPTIIGLTAKNIGSTHPLPQIKLTLDNNYSFVSASLPVSSINNQEIIWDLDSLEFQSSSYFQVKIIPNTALAIGDSVHFSATVYPLANDETPENNTSKVDGIIIGSFDPNDKKVTPNTNYSPDYLSEKRPLVYTIRFQNTGNYHADNVRITDTLNENLDINTFKVLSASHPMEWSIRGENAIEFAFKNIFLPDSTTNEQASHGFVKYSILPKNDIELGALIDNTAFIYFDFNDPIITNTTETKFDHLVALWSLSHTVESMDILPNPAFNQITLHLAKATTGKAQIEIYDIWGQSIFPTVRDAVDGQINLDLPNLQQGIYLVKVEIKNDIFLQKLIIHK